MFPPTRTLYPRSTQPFTHAEILPRRSPLIGHFDFCEHAFCCSASRTARCCARGHALPESREHYTSYKPSSPPHHRMHPLQSVSPGMGEGNVGCGGGGDGTCACGYWTKLSLLGRGKCRRQLEQRLCQADSTSERGHRLTTLCSLGGNTYSRHTQVHMGLCTWRGWRRRAMRWRSSR